MTNGLREPPWSLPKLNLSDMSFSNFDNKAMESIAEIVIRAWLESQQASNTHSSLFGLDEEDEDGDVSYEDDLE